MAKKKTTKRNTTGNAAKGKRRRVKSKSVAPTPVGSADSANASVPVVGIGASAGGLSAFKKFFSGMPVDSGMSFVLVPHLDPTHESLMAKKKTPARSTPAYSLRARAEELLRAKPSELPTLPTADVQALVHELNVHQMELEIQNDELCQAQLDLAHSRDRYSNLYDFAPVGYATLDKDGMIREANLTAATLLGAERKTMIGKNLSTWITREAQDDFYLHRRAVFSHDQETKHVCELKMQPANGKSLVVRLESMVFESDSARQCRTALIDVTQQSKAKEDIRQLNETLEQRVADQTCEVRLLAEAMASLGEGVMITSDHLDWPGPEIVYVNEALCRITGYTAEELIGQTPRMLQGTRTDQQTIARLRQELSKKRSHLCELVNYRKDGTTYDAELFITPLFDADGNHTNFIAIHRDITARKRAEDDLRRLSKVFLDAANAIFIMDLSGCITDINRAAELQYGWTRDELIGHSIKKLVPSEQHSQRDELKERCIRGEEVRGVEAIRVTKSGELIPVLLTFSLLTDTSGQPTGIAAIAEDITERKQAERSLRENEERMRAILNTAADAIITINQRGIIEGVNAATESMFGYSRAELIGQNVKILMPSPYCDEHDGYIARYLETGQPRIIGIGREVIGRRKDGSTFPVALSVSEVDHLGLFTGIVHDISDRRELQKQILEIAAEEDRRIGHELHDNVQQQLTGLGLLAQSQAEALTQASSPRADLAARLAKGLREAANHVHLLSRGLVPVEVDAQGLRSALTDLASTVSEQYSVRCNFQCVGSVNRLDNFSATHLYRIAQEAINNAVKHGKAERIELSLTGDDESIALKVLDNGIGIGAQRENGPGMGLRIMDYRAGLIGATVQVVPRKDGGTLVSCTTLRGGSLQ